jgi:ribosomal subunit interface protein
MDIRIKQTDYSITPDVQNYLDQKLASLEKLLGSEAALARVDVELGRDAGGQRHGEHMWFAEITIRTPGGDDARATNRASGINAAIDDVKEEIETQLRRNKKFHIKMIKRSGQALKRFMRFGDE